MEVSMGKSPILFFFQQAMFDYRMVMGGWTKKMAIQQTKKEIWAVMEWLNT